MNDFGDPWITRHANYFSDPDAGPDALLNDATEWLRYTHNGARDYTYRWGTYPGATLPGWIGGPTGPA